MDTFDVDDPDGQGRWRFDVEFLRSGWRCTWGESCLGIDDHPDPTHHRGCCTLGAELTGEADAANLAAHAACLDPARWEQAHAAAAGGIFTSADRTATRVVDGACIFLNSEHFTGGAGCALHLAAVRDGEPPHEWKPDVCWELPIKIENSTDPDGTPVWLVRRWQRRDFGTDGETMAWWCTDDLPAPADPADRVVHTLGTELDELCGPDVTAAMRAALDAADPPIPPTP